MKTTIVTLACCALFAPLAFAQLASKPGKSQVTTYYRTNNGNRNVHQNND